MVGMGYGMTGHGAWCASYGKLSMSGAQARLHSLARSFTRCCCLHRLFGVLFPPLLRIVYQQGRTGFEVQKDFEPKVDDLIAGRYKVRVMLGSAAFSSAVACTDIVQNREVCLKIVRNNKDFFDQSLDEIKLLRYINSRGDTDRNNVVEIFDYFYHKEHLIIVTEVRMALDFDTIIHRNIDARPPLLTMPGGLEWWSHIELAAFTAAL